MPPRFALLLFMLLIAAPAVAQSRVYTNADLTAGPVVWQRPLPGAEEVRGLLAHQFVLPRTSSPRDPISVSIGSRTDGPFGALQLTPTKSLAEPWSVTTYYGKNYVETLFNGRPFPGQEPSFPRHPPRR
jgi:hypothetical protein